MRNTGKMKLGKLVTLLMLLFAFANVNAQEDVSDCAKYKSLYYQYLKQSMWRDAMTFWGKAYTACTESGEGVDFKFMKNGRVGYSQLMKLEEKKKEAANATLLKNYADTLDWIYAEGMKLDEDKEWRGDYANFLLDQKDERHDLMDSLYMDCVHSLKSQASYGVIRGYFIHLILNKFNDATPEGKEEVRGFIIEEYVVLSEYTEEAISRETAAGDERQVKGYENAQDFLDKYFLKIAKDCDALVPVLTKKYETLPADQEARLEQVNKFLKLLDKKDCQDTDIYEKYLDEKLNLDPTAEAYYFKGNLMLKKDRASDAITAFEKAVELEGEGENKNLYLYKVAVAEYSAHRYKAAFSTAKKVGGKYKGDALLICANSIAATANDCGESTFERKANFWLANDYVQQAIANGADASSSKYLSNAPDDNDIFQEGKAKGDKITLSCWGESTTIR